MVSALESVVVDWEGVTVADWVGVGVVDFGEMLMLIEPFRDEKISNLKHTQTKSELKSTMERISR
jgi:hypothetical protein